MNYRHAFHAGNHCDVLKHAALALTLGRLLAKEAPYMVLDTHAGRGLYDLESEAAGRSGEHLGGVARIFEDAEPPGALTPYLDAVKRQNPFGGLRWYPGSPVIVREALRGGDSLKLCELNEDERLALETAIGRDRRVKIFNRDGYQAVRAFLPPAERRGLVLIDPPFEKPGEFARLAGAVADGIEHWASGIFMIWRPVKDDQGHADFMKAVRQMAIAKTLSVELSVAPRIANRLTGSGLFIVNPPFGLADALIELLPYLAATLATAPGGGWALVETERGRTLRDLHGKA